MTPFELPEADGCAFCLLALEPKSPRIVEQTELTMTFINGRQFEVGQVIVIPRRHASTLLDLTNDEAAAVMLAVRRVAHALVCVYQPDGITLYQNNGTVSLQEVPHFHMHVVPRRKNSGWGEGPPHIAPLERRGDEISRKVEVGIEQQRGIANTIKPHLEHQPLE